MLDRTSTYWLAQDQYLLACPTLKMYAITLPLSFDHVATVRGKERGGSFDMILNCVSPARAAKSCEKAVERLSQRFLPLPAIAYPEIPT